MEERKEYRIGELYNVQNGLSKGGEFFGTGYPFVSFKTVFNNYFLPVSILDLAETSVVDRIKYSVKRGDILITRTSETAEELGMSCVALSDMPNATYNGFCKRLRPCHNDIVLPEYIGYLFRSKAIRSIFNSLSSMTTRASLRNDDLLGIKLSLPTINEQKKVASILRTIDTKIELNRRINDNLEQQAQALFKSWFVDFEPFKDGKFVDSEMGMIPEGWKVVQLGEIIEISKRIINPQKNPDKIFYHYSLPACDNGLIPEIQSGKDIMSNKIILQNNTILFSKLNPRIKRIWFACDVLNDSICSTEFIPYRAKNERESVYIYSIINSDSFYASVLGCVNGATGSHQRFHAEDTLGLLFPYKKDIVDKYIDLVKPVLAEIHKLRIENKTLALTRDSLLPRLMSGELKFNDLNN